MKTQLPAIAILLAVSASTATAAECGGPFRQCAIEVQATCSRDANGRERWNYWDHPGNTARFERCVGGIFESRGLPNPYKTGITSAGGLTVPYTELHYPLNRDRR